MLKELRLGFIYVIVVYLIICAYCKSSSGETIIPEENNIYTSLPNCKIISVVQSRNIAGIEDVIKSGANVNCQNKFGKTALMIAAELNPDAVPLLLDYGADVNLVDRHGMTALMMATENSNTTSMKYLIEAGTDLEKRETGLVQTALMIACTRSSKDTIKLLLDAGADIDARGMHGQTVLMDNIQMKGGDSIELLLEYGVDINAIDDYKITALMVAAEYGNMKTIEKILSYKPVINRLSKGGTNEMFFAVLNKNPEIKEIIELLIKSGSDLNVTDKDGRNVLLYAAIYKYIQAIKPLMELGVNINSTDNQGRTFFSLMTSTEYYPAYEYKEIINEFIKLGADINKCDKAGMSPLMYAIVNSNTEAFEILINAGADVSLKDFKGYDFVDYLEQSSDTEAIDKIIKIAEQKNIISQDRIVQLYSAREKYNQMVSDFNHVEVNLPDIVMEPAKTPDINEILSQISDINKQDEEGKTFLMFMCEQGCDIETVKTIVKAGIDINIKDSNDQTALMLAAQKCSPQIVHFLINAGADIKSVRQDSKNILMYAAQNNDSNVVDMFIKKIDVNALMKDNWTALMFAARDGSTETVKKLIKAGADVKAKTVNGKDLLLNAIDHDNIETMKLFIDAGADVTSKRSDYHGDPLHWAGFMSQKKETILFLIDQITKKEKPDEYIFEALDSALFNFDNSYASKEVLDCLKDVAKKTDSERYKNSLANTLAEQARSISSTQKIQELIDDGADPNGHDKFGATILMNAAQNEIPEIIQVILKYDVDIDAVSGGNKYTALHYAVAFNPNIKIAKILIEAGADIKNNQTYGNLGEVAAKNKNPEMIQFLKDYDLYNDIDNGKALAEAACNSNLTQVKQLISSGVTKEELSKALLNAAQHKFNGIRSMELEIIKELVNAGADVNVKYDAPTQWTVLMLLCGDIYTPTEVIQFLVDKGADVNAKANGKHTPLLAASGEGTPEIVKILVNAGANMEDKNFRDQTPLLMALAHNKLQNFDMLVSLGAKVNGSNSYALLSGALLGYSQNKNEMFEMLMSVGVDINATNKDGQNILMGLCQLSDDISLIQMVLDNGADITMRDTKGNDAQYYLQRNKSLKDSDILTKKN